MITTSALTHRPKRWEELVGQRLPTKVLQSALRQQQLSPAYLFEGKTGCGKTSAALLMTKRILCQNPEDANPCSTCSSCVSIDKRTNPNVLYVDGASDKSVAFVKDELVPFLRAVPVAASKRVVILDEAHLLKRDAISIFLTLLEKMPPHSLIVFCTTEDVLPELKNRCFSLRFNSLDYTVVGETIADRLGFQDKAPFILLAKEAGGSFRQAWSFVDVWQQTEESLTEETLYELIGAITRRERAALWRELSERKLTAVQNRWADWLKRGASPNKVGAHLIDDLIQMAVQAPDKPDWHRALALLANIKLSGDSELWLPALLSLGGIAYHMPVDNPLEEAVVHRDYVFLGQFLYA